MLLGLLAVMNATGSAAQAVVAQQPSFVHESWTVEDGLPVNAVNRVLQSPDGYIWLATWDGLVRFDGVRFTVFNIGNSVGLPSNRIMELVDGRDGSLWMITEQSHLVRLLAGTFTHFAAQNGLPDGSTRSLHLDSEGRCWVGTEQGVFRLDDDRFVPVEQQSIREPVESLLHDRAGNLWVGTRTAGLFRVKSGEVEQFSEAEGMAASWISVLSEDSSGTIWIGTHAGLHRFRDGTLSAPYTIEGVPLRAHIREIVPAPAGDSIWVSAEEGIYAAGDGDARVVLETPGHVALPRVRADAEGVVWYSMGDNLYRDGVHVFQVSLRGAGEVRPVAQIQTFDWDHEGSLWITTYSMGLHRLKPALFAVYSEAEGLAYRNVASVLEDREGTLWFGTNGHGLSRLSKGRITNYTPDHRSRGFFLSLMQDRDGSLWAGTLRLGILYCQLPSMRCGPPPGGQPDSEATVYALHQEEDGTIWAGTDRGLFRLYDGTWERVAVAELPMSSIVRTFLEARDGTLWMGTSGTGVLAHRDARFSSFRTRDGLPSDLIRALHEDESGRIWVGTEGRGLVRLTIQLGDSNEPVRAVASRAVRQRDGLFDEVIHRILPDDDGRLWMSTNRGIFWVSFAELDAFADGRRTRISSTSYTESSGLRHREANGGYHPAGIRSRDGRLWFPTQDGAAVVDPSSVIRNPVPPSVVIESVGSGEESWLPDASPLVLAPNQRNFEIDYTALSFLSPENVHFRYRLDGLHDDWTDAGNRRTAFYTNVPPGRYVFRVIASNNDGIWNEEGASLAFRVAPRFHETRGFFLILVLIAGALLVAIIRLRSKRLETRAKELTLLVNERTGELRDRERQLAVQNAQLAAQADRDKELDRAKTSFFQNVSHELRTPLTLTIGPLEDLRERLKGAGGETASALEMALRNARRLLQLVNQILDVARLESGHMRLHAREIELGDFARSITSEFVGIAYRRGILLEFTRPQDGVIALVDSDSLEKVLTNLLGNAFKHTPEGGRIHVLVEARTDGELGDVARLIVTDSGPGIADEDLPHVFQRFYQAQAAGRRSPPGTGIGLSLARELVELHGGRLDAANQPGAGAVFTCTLPLHPDLPREDEHPGDQLKLEPPSENGLELAESDSPSFEPTDIHEGEDVTTLLVVDDSADLRAWMRKVFERRYRVIEAADGAGALELARRFLPDLVLTDVMMPRMDGRALVEALRSSPETDFIPVILLTAQASREQRLAGLSEGADDYVVKPFDMPELEARVENLITTRRRLRQRFSERRVELTPGASDLSPVDREFVERVRRAIEVHLSDPSFGVAELAREAFQDRSHLFRRTRELLGEAPSELIRRLRLEHASRLLVEEEHSVADVAYACGFNSVSYFCQAFRRAYDASPSEYREKVHQS